MADCNGEAGTSTHPKVQVLEARIAARRGSQDIAAVSPDRILTISAADYCTIAGKSLSDYVAQGVHLYGGYGSNAQRCFIQEIPCGTEVVVAYTAAAGDAWVAMSGTALIPKAAQEARRD